MRCHAGCDFSRPPQGCPRPRILPKVTCLERSSPIQSQPMASRRRRGGGSSSSRSPSPAPSPPWPAPAPVPATGVRLGLLSLALLAAGWLLGAGSSGGLEQLAGKRVVITGASQGIGEQMVSTRILGRRTAPFHLSLFPSRMVLREPKILVLTPIACCSAGLYTLQRRRLCAAGGALAG